MDKAPIRNIETPPGGWPVPRSAYIHIPFCRHRCGYCNFSVVAGRDDLVDTVLDAIDSELERLDRPQLSTLFIGGGTPTHLDQPRLERLLGMMHDRFTLAPDVEWSVEANPEDISDIKLRLLSEHGVNRVSLGVQSFDSRKLVTLERSHSPKDAQDAVRRTAEFIPNVSLDLIFAAPGESNKIFQDDLQTAFSLPIKHLSTYALTYEKGTSFWTRRYRGRIESASEALEVALYQSAIKAAVRAGFRQYEISSFAAPEYRCRHNVSYWLGRGWFAAGPGAARFVDGARTTNHRSTTTYVKRISARESPIAETDTLTPLEYAKERAAFGLRMLDGVDVDAFAEETGYDFEAEFAKPLDVVLSAKYVIYDQRRYRLTPQGILFADTVAAEFLG